MTVTMIKVRPDAEAALLAEIDNWETYRKFNITDPAQLRDQALLNEVFCHILAAQTGATGVIVGMDLVMTVDIDVVAETLFEDEHLQILVRLMEFSHSARHRNKWTRLRLALESGDLPAAERRVGAALNTVRSLKWQLTASKGRLTMRMLAQFQ